MSEKVWCDFGEVKRRVTIKECMAALGIDLGQYVESHTDSTTTLTGPCPLPSHKVVDPRRRNKRQFRVDSPGRDCNYDLFHCFSNDHAQTPQSAGNGTGGNVIQFVAQMLQCDLAHTRHFFAKFFADRISTSKPPHEVADGDQRERIDGTLQMGRPEPRPSVPFTAVVDDNAVSVKPMARFLELEPDHPYLRERGIHPETAAAFRIGYCRRGVLAEYIAIPLFDCPHPQGKPPLTYLGRYAAEDYAEKGKPKYRWGQKGFPKSRFVYNLDSALKVESDCLICCEGAFDVFRLTQAGFPQSVAIIGASMSDEQARLLAGTGRKVVLAFDGGGEQDSSGRAGMRTAAAKLLRHKGSFVSVVFLPDNSDPASLSAEDLKKVFRFVS